MTLTCFYTDAIPFPELLLDYNLSDKTLRQTLSQVGSGEAPAWFLGKVPTIEFYRNLHTFLRKWPVSRYMSKKFIGSFYMAIDNNLKRTRSRPDNVYRLVERVVMSDSHDTEAMKYGCSQTHQLRRQLNEQGTLVDNLAEKVQKQGDELLALKMKMNQVQEELVQTKEAVNGVTKKVDIISKKRDAALESKTKLARHFEEVCADNAHYEELLIEEGVNFSEIISKLKTSTVDKECIIFHTLDNGKQFTPTLRNLYYQLLADQVPLVKIKSSIKAVIKCFFPCADVDNLRLPSESCANYMRQHELKTVSMIHKASTLAETDCIHLNSDGTTKFQRKIEGTAFNGMVISVNEVPDGCAKSILADISREFQKLREIAHELNLPYADKINWTLVSSSTSDSASTQKKFNQLLLELKEEDEEKFGPASSEAIEMVENFCAMHLGVNLRKAFVDGTKVTSTTEEPSERREYNQIDTLVHEFCKLFGKHGVPEYGAGASKFVDFLNLMLEEGRSPPAKAAYYLCCTKISLARQVGSRYFVTASNASKSLFLVEAACDFLKYTGKDTVGNKLECDLFRKLQDVDELARLKADALMFHHVYADLVTLAKSNELSKSALDMNKHYLELKLFLGELEENPQTIFNKDFKVFYSESRIYEQENQKVNHRAHSTYKPIEERLFKKDSWDEKLLLPLIAAGTRAMKNKLCAYAKNQLPGGIYWEPEPAVRAILAKLKPTNDLCESILGLNDHLTTGIRNLSQLTRSNLIEVKKNKTVQWLNTLPQEKQQEVVKMAAKRRTQVKKDYQGEQEMIRVQRTKKLLLEKQKRRKRAEEQLLKLSRVHLIASPSELRAALSKIDQSSISAAKKRTMKMSLVKDQINIRKKVHKQTIRIPFTQCGKKRSLDTVISELTEFITSQQESSAQSLQDPTSLVGKHIEQRFEVEGESQWFSGIVIGYDPSTELHEVTYYGENEDEHCYFNLMEDLLQNDLRIV